jgi:hypothetical protein
MTSYQIVKAALQFTRPERLPVRMGCFGVDDTVWVPRKNDTYEEDGVQKDEWGCVWAHTEMANMGQVKGHPLSDLSEIDKVRVPDYSQDWRYEDSEEALAQAEREGRYTQVGIFMVLFERMHTLASFETVLMGLLADRANAEALADLILETQISLVREAQRRFGTRLHSFSMTDDWGTQQAAFISRELWDDFFLPRYAKLFDVMHAGGQDVWVHSCGKVNEIVGGLIEAGVDAVNLQQPRALGITEMGERYRGKVAFESLADIQHTLPTCEREEIETDARDLAQHWMSPEGGFVFSDYGDGRAIGTPIEAKQMMYEAFSQVSEEVYGKPLPEARYTEASD